MSQAHRVLALVLACLCTLLLCLWMLGQDAARLHQQDMAVQRDGYLLRHLRTTAESYLATGLQLDQMQALQDMLEREQAVFSGILAIDVFNAGGVLLYSTDVGSRGTSVPEPWRAILAQEQPWQGAAPGQRQIGQRFDNDLGQAAGAIVITLNAVAEPPTLAQWQERGQQLLRWLAMALVALAGTTLAMRAALWRLGRPYGRAADILQAGAQVPGVPSPGATPLEQSAWQVQRSWQAGHQRCRDGLQQLEALDHAL